MNNLRFGAHEYLETQELVRKVSADIELHAVCAEMTQDQELKSLLTRHIQGMQQTFQQSVNALQNKGISANTTMNTSQYGLHTNTQPKVGLHNPTMYPPNPNAQRLSDVTICTILLNSHKAGSVFGMQWANECVDPQLRQLHITCATNCNAMAYEIWQYMNAKGMYQVPQLADHTMQTMNNAFNTMQPMNQNQNQNPNYQYGYI
ncbi:spore coat protein [Bacillus sp. Marseille-P3661]|uniref:spore coat protein n=1 Tax=Bacillus sp. Marseille-P3661 TaxID=1936234 RepID=UPI000C857545|nr:spore coat protein [Bacillus sp. Marseille-P3661]